jgi:glycosyltransferase involved in cell wall biosynthesis
MRVLLATDSFPPRCGGSGWSTYELARGLRARGHEIAIVQPKPGTPPELRDREYDGFAVVEVGVTAPDVPYVRNYFKNERLFPAVTRVLIDRIAAGSFDIVHGQHVLTCLPAIDAGAARGIPSVCTVRDYWPVCYWSDLIHTKEGLALCPACSAGMMTACVRPRSGALWPLALPMIPYMRGNLARKRQGLARAGAVVAVSSTIAADLRARAPELAATRIEVIPNPVDVAALRAAAAAAPRPIDGDYALYLGKLAPNKGTAHLVDIAERADLDWPLAIVGDGPDADVVRAAAARSKRDIRLVGWVDRNDAMAWLAHASLLIFTSRGPESLSRVLIEASALGIPIAAMKTGGTPDIISHEVTGLLSDSPEALAADVRRLRHDASLRQRLGENARAHAARTFDAPAVVARIEALYRELRPGSR